MPNAEATCESNPRALAAIMKVGVDGIRFDAHNTRAGQHTGLSRQAGRVRDFRIAQALLRKLVLWIKAQGAAELSKLLLGAFRQFGVPRAR